MNPNSSNNANNNRSDHLNVQRDEVPPPPYSETDVYSTSNGSRSPHPAVAATAPSHGFVDDAASSTTSDPVYTPPLTSRASSDSGQPAASLYFDQRAVSRQTVIPHEPLIHTIEVNDVSRPDDFPYQNEWETRDITTIDWSTFINFLIPDHTTRENEAILHRKLRDEMQSNSGRTNDTATQVEAQLGQIADAGVTPSPDAIQRRRDVEVTVQQWNDGFFSPRGVEVRLQPMRATSAQMPGAWETNFDQRPEPARSTQSPQTAGRSGPAGWGPWSNLQMDNNGVRFGNSFVADQNGLRIGNLVMDQHGIRFGNGEAPGQQQQQRQPPYGVPAADADQDVRGRSAYPQGGSYPNEKEDHKRSSSCSSSASSESSSSESSIGSLPSYDGVPQRSMQLYIARLEDWTKHPDQLRTKQDIKQLKAELKNVPKSRDASLDVEKKALRAQIKTLTSEWRQIKKSQRKERRNRRRERRDRKRAEKRERRQHKRDMKRAQKEARRGPPSHPSHPSLPPFPPMPPHPSGRSVPPMPPMPPHLPGHPVPPVPPMPSVHPTPFSGGFPWGSRGPRRGGRHSHRGGGRGFRNDHQHPYDQGWAGDNGLFGTRGPFGSGGPFGAGGPFGEKGIFGGGSDACGSNGFFGYNSEEQKQQQEQQKQQREQQQEQQKQQREQQQQQMRQQHEQIRQQHEQAREQHEQARQQHEQQMQQQREQARQQHEQQMQQIRQQGGGYSSSRSMPGFWPDEKQDQSNSLPQDDQKVPPPGAASAKYRAMEGIETAIEHQLAAADNTKPGPEKDALEKGVAELMRQLETMRMDADEEYARELGGN